eukprot:jgi/Psemu1/38330/gm1.38330_g
MSMTSLSAQEEGRPFVEAAELHGTYFKCEDEDERVTRVSQLDVFQHLDSSIGTNDNNNNNNNNNTRGGQDPLEFAIRRKRERRKKLAMNATNKVFPSLSKGMVKRSNKLNKGHICLKWHSATKAQSKIEVVRDPTANTPPSPPTPEKIGEADPLNWSTEVCWR